jgi:hypothetical protein
VSGGFLRGGERDILRPMAELLWKASWDRTRERFAAWWRREGLVFSIMAPRDTPVEQVPVPDAPADVRMRWTDPGYRLADAEARMAGTYYGAESFPVFDPQLGPGNLATFIGSEPDYTPDTVWYNPCITDPDAHPALAFDPEGRHYSVQMAIVETALAAARGRYLVGFPDLIENVDILVSLRGMERLLEDMMDRPAFVEERVAQINGIWFDVYERMRQRIGDAWGGTTWACFNIWGQGRTAKLQCDASAAFSPAMFHRYVVPALSAQCRWLDNSLYHLDGQQCIAHLDELLAIEDLDVIQWTAGAGRPGAGDPRWYDLYRRILAGGKGVMAPDVRPDQVVPLLDAVGSKGLYIGTWVENEDRARRLEEKVDAYR